MNNKEIDLIKLAVKNNQRNKLKTCLLSLILIIILIIILVPFTFYMSYQDLIDNSINNLYSTKYISVYEYTEEQSNAIKDYLNDKDYIVRIDNHYKGAVGGLPQNDFFHSKKGYLFVLPIIPYNSPNDELIDSGSLPKESGEAICPSKTMLGTFDNEDLDKSINLKSNLKPKLDISFPVFNDDGEIIDYFDKSFKLVGTYDAGPSYSYNTCYILENDYDIIEKNISTKEPSNDTLVIYIKHVNDKEKVTNFLDKVGVKYEAHELDLEFLKLTIKLTLIISIILCFITLIIITIHIKNYFKDYYQSLTLYKALGFTRKEIIKIMLYEIVEIFSFVFILVLIFGFAIGKILQRMLNQTTSFETFNVVIAWQPVFIFFLLISILTYFILRKETKIIDSYTVSELKGKTQR